MTDANAMLKAIRRIVRAIDVRSKEVARETGLTIPQIVLLRAIRDMGEVTTRALSAQADLSPATVVTILDKLEERGLVGRYRSEEDRRVVHTRLTAEGERVLAAAPPLLHDQFIRALDALPSEERAALVAAVARVADMMDPQGEAVAPILTLQIDQSAK